MLNCFHGDLREANAIRSLMCVSLKSRGKFMRENFSKNYTRERAKQYSRKVLGSGKVSSELALS